MQYALCNVQYATYNIQCAICKLCSCKPLPSVMKSSDEDKFKIFWRPALFETGESGAL